MRIVITGGCGFLGRRVALRLLERGTEAGPVDELVLFDNGRRRCRCPKTGGCGSSPATSRTATRWDG